MRTFLAAAQVIAFYWRKPAIWPALWREGLSYLDRRVRPGQAQDTRCRLAHERTQAEAWCASHAVSIEDLHRHLPFEFALSDPEAEHRGIFAAARDRVEACPRKLGGAGNVRLLYSLTRALGARRIVETGVAYGWSSLALLLALEGNAAARLVSVDMPYLTMMNDDWVGVAVPSELRAQWQLIRMADRQGLPKAINMVGAIDLAHYDSDKSYGGRLFAYDLIWQALRPGGVLVSDDISDNLAFRDFSISVDRIPIIIAHHSKYQGILVR